VSSQDAVNVDSAPGGHALVMFSAGRLSNRDLSRRKLARIAWRHPGRVYRWSLAWLIRHVGGGDLELCHVVIAYQGAVLDPSISGNRFWPTQRYIGAANALRLAYFVPLDRPIDLDRYPPCGRKPILPTFLRWWTGGRWPTQDCVTVVCDMLRAGGIPVPPRTWKPITLQQWLESQAYERFDIQ